MPPLTILFNTYPVAFDCPGGGEVQLLKYMEALESLGVRTLRYDPWNPQPQFDAADIVHYFSVQAGSWRFSHHVKHVRKLPLVVSSIIWIDDPAKYGMDEIKHNLHYADHILPNSQAECDQLAQVFSMDSALFTPIVNGVDDIFFKQCAPNIFREHYFIQNPFVLCMGNIEERKNQLRLIQALKGTGIHIVLAGQEREAEYTAQCRQEADETVHFIGTIAHGSELQRSAYAACDAFILPSTLETPGLAALEAAAAGCKLSVTQEGCTKEYFKEFATYLNPYDINSIKNSVVTTLNSDINKNISKYIHENFTWNHAAKQLIAVYEKLLSNKK